jgi:hypothetical protein
MRSKDSLQAELWASHFLGMIGRYPLVGETDTVSAVGGRFVAVARRSRTPAARGCLAALAAVAEGDLGARASRAVSELAESGASAPGWLEVIGTAEPTAAWRVTDLCGDQDSVMVGFRHADGVEHTVLVLIDHIFGGIAKDIAVLGPLSEVLASWSETSDVELVEEPVGSAAALVVEAMETTSRTMDAPVSDDFGDYEALARARLGPLAGVVPEAGPPLDDIGREALVKAFLAAPAGAKYVDDPAAWFLLDALVDYRCDYHHRGDPLRWSGGAALLFLLDFVPRKVTARGESLARMPEVLRAWVPWAAERVGLPAHLVAETVDVTREIEIEFAAAIADESRWGPAKQLAMAMVADGVDLADTEAANAWLGARTAHA